MHVGLLRVTLHIPAARSLKDRRAVVRRAVERVRARFPVSVAEVGDSAHWQRATIAVVVVSGDAAVARDVLDRCTTTIANSGDAVITDRELELLAYSDQERFGEALFGGVFDSNHNFSNERGDDGEDQDR
jgi:uncharacterized protein YlxP (DUF503 family)